MPLLKAFCKKPSVWEGKSKHVLKVDVVVQNVGHHLVGAGRLQDLKQLLASPGWLERKLHSYGTASAVADFRRWVP